jgi:restriction system protein
MTQITKTYLTRGGRHGEDEEFALENGLAIIGFHDIPSLQSAANYDDVYSLVAAKMPNAKPRAIGNRAGQLWAFSIALELGDIVVMPRKQTSQIALGKVTGPYKYQKINGEFRHTRSIKWIRPDVPRTVFGQDILNSLGAFMTVCNIARNDAARRIALVLEGKADPGFQATVTVETNKGVDPSEVIAEEVLDLEQLAHDQIVAHIQSRFVGHSFSALVETILRADGWVTKLSPPGPDGGVDILGGRGPLGLDAPRLCVQVKSQNSPADVTIYRTLQGSMQSFKAEQGLLVCWGGFNKSVLNESRQGHFSVRLWNSGDVVEAIYRTYEKLPAEIQAELPLKRVWMLVQDEVDE